MQAGKKNGPFSQNPATYRATLPIRPIHAGTDHRDVDIKVMTYSVLIEGSLG